MWFGAENSINSPGEHGVAKIEGCSVRIGNLGDEHVGTTSTLEVSVVASATEFPWMEGRPGAAAADDCCLP